MSGGGWVTDDRPGVWFYTYLTLFTSQTYTVCMAWEDSFFIRCTSDKWRVKVLLTQCKKETANISPSPAWACVTHREACGKALHFLYPNKSSHRYITVCTGTLIYSDTSTANLRTTLNLWERKQIRDNAWRHDKMKNPEFSISLNSESSAQSIFYFNFPFCPLPPSLSLFLSSEKFQSVFECKVELVRTGTRTKGWVDSHSCKTQFKC